MAGTLLSGANLLPHSNYKLQVLITAVKSFTIQACPLGSRESLFMLGNGRNLRRNGYYDNIYISSVFSTWQSTPTPYDVDGCIEKTGEMSI
jgi:hypothetical protein